MEILFLAKKLISFFIQPYGLILLLLIIGVILLFSKYQKLAKTSLLLAISLFIILSNPWVANSLSFNLENKFQKYEVQNYKNQSLDFIATLGNGHNENKALPISSILSDAGTKRVLEAVRIYHLLDKKPKIIFTGHSGFGYVKTYAQMASNFAQKFGVSLADMIIKGGEKDTGDEAQSIKKIVKNKKVILITSATHMLRATNYFKKYGVKIIPAPADFLTNNKGIFAKPSFKYLQQSSIAIHEYFGLLWQKIKY